MFISFRKTEEVKRLFFGWQCGNRRALRRVVRLLLGVVEVVIVSDQTHREVSVTFVCFD